MTTIKLLIEYDGTAYAGWQRQADQPTVQEAIETALAKTLGEPTTLYGAGRTDAGVHALGQVAHFKCESSIPAEKFAPALQQHLPADILIKSSTQAPDGFHARFDATARQYRYHLAFTRSALWRNRRWELPEAVALDTLNEFAALFSGDLDCAALCIPNSLQENNRCLITQSRWETAGDECHFHITANRFLHSMVRAIVGFCVKGALESRRPQPGLTVQRVRDILEAGTWTTDHAIAPPQGLYLVEVTY
ncbi:MAG TPA: tRNA pseudouridine(38-40) synthase TruA [candidate division Zixibacteria bacterium]|nr:tRNA pseudouridine(38-40) synthase TruA [candidate division Zixibacteria bacterium]